MKLNYLSIFTLIFIFFFAMNFIAAEELGENYTGESLKIDLNTQDTILLDSGENSISNCDNEDIDDSEVLSSEDSIQHIYVSPEGRGDGTSYENSSSIKDALEKGQDNTIIHLAEGNYTIPSSNKAIKLKGNNITIIADSPEKVILKSAMGSVNYNDFEISSLSNVTFKDIIFQGGVKGKWAFSIDKSNGVYFENCTFVNYNNYKRIIRVSSSRIYLNYCNISNNSIKDNIINVVSSISTDTNVLINNCIFINNLAFNNELKPLFNSDMYAYLTICGCEFINNNGSCLFYASSGTFQTTGEILFNLSISSSVFRSNINNMVLIDSKYYTLIFENNTVDEGIVELDEGHIISPTTLTVLNNTQVTVGSGENIDVTFVLTDDKGNIIKVPKITFKLDSNSCNATYDAGAYHYSYTAPEVTERTPIYIDTIESDFSNPIIKMQTEPIIVKPSLNLSADDISDSVYGDEITVKVNISNLESGNLIYEFVNDNGFTKNVTDSFTNNVSSVTVNYLPVGDYTLNVKYAEDDDFVASVISKTFSVGKANSTVQIIIDPTIPVGDNITVQAVLPANARGNVTYRLNNDNKTVNVTDNAIFAGLANGTYTIYAKYNGDDNYNESEWFSTTFEVVKISPGLTLSADPVTYGEPLVVIVSTNTKFTGDIIVKIANLNETAHVVNGVGNASFANLTAAEYFIEATFNETEMFIAETKNTTAVVKGIDIPADQAVDTTVPANSKSPTFSISLPEDATGNFTVSVDGKVVETKELINGKASITVNDLPAGNHNISIAYSGDGKFAPITENTTLTINKLSTSITASAVSTVYGVSKKLTITLKDANNNLLAGKTVKVVLNGVTYTGTTDAKGQISITVPNNLAAKTYTAKVTFAGDSEYVNAAKDVTVTVKKAATKITAKKKTFKAKLKTKKYTVTLKANNKAVKKVKLTLKVKGKTYKATTNAKGKATFKIKKLTKKGKHTATIKFNGNKNLKATTKKIKITIK